MNSLLLIIGLLGIVVIISLLLVMYSRKQPQQKVAQKLIQDIKQLPTLFNDIDGTTQLDATEFGGSEFGGSEFGETQLETENFGMYTGALQTWLDNHVPIEQKDTVNIINPRISKEQVKYVNTINSNYQPNLEGFNENVRFQTPRHFEIHENPTKLSQIKR